MGIEAARFSESLVPIYLYLRDIKSCKTVIFIILYLLTSLDLHLFKYLQFYSFSSLSVCFSLSFLLLQYYMEKETC